MAENSTITEPRTDLVNGMATYLTQDTRWGNGFKRDPEIALVEGLTTEEIGSLIEKIAKILNIPIIKFREACQEIMNGGIGKSLPNEFLLGAYSFREDNHNGREGALGWAIRKYFAQMLNTRPRIFVLATDLPSEGSLYGLSWYNQEGVTVHSGFHLSTREKPINGYKLDRLFNAGKMESLTPIDEPKIILVDPRFPGKHIDISDEKDH